MRMQGCDVMVKVAVGATAGKMHASGRMVSRHQQPQPASQPADCPSTVLSTHSLPYNRNGIFYMPDCLCQARC